MSNRDWDPCYLHEVVSQDFFEFEELWRSNIKDMDLVSELTKVEDKYCPITEDINLDDEVLCSAVEEIEHK